MLRDGTVRVLLPLQELKVVHVDQDLELGGGVLLVRVGVQAEVPHAGVVEARLAVDFTHVVRSPSVVVEDAHRAIGEDPFPGHPLEVHVLPKQVGPLGDPRPGVHLPGGGGAVGVQRGDDLLQLWLQETVWIIPNKPYPFFSLWYILYIGYSEQSRENTQQDNWQKDRVQVYALNNQSTFINKPQKGNSILNDFVIEWTLRTLVNKRMPI
jgi:hypothetical protein